MPEPLTELKRRVENAIGIEPENRERGVFGSAEPVVPVEPNAASTMSAQRLVVVRGVMRCEPESPGEIKPDSSQPIDERENTRRVNQSAARNAIHDTTSLQSAPTWAGFQRDKAISAQRASKPQNGRRPACGQRLDSNSQSAPPSLTKSILEPPTQF